MSGHHRRLFFKIENGQFQICFIFINISEVETALMFLDRQKALMLVKMSFCFGRALIKGNTMIQKGIAQWFFGGDFAPQGTCGNVWKHFWPS